MYARSLSGSPASFSAPTVPGGRRARWQQICRIDLQRIGDIDEGMEQHLLPPALDVAD